MMFLMVSGAVSVDEGGVSFWLPGNFAASPPRPPGQASAGLAAAFSKTNADSTVDVHFAAKPPAGRESNWVPTREDKPFFVMFRIYGPQKGAVDGSWMLNNIEKVN